MGFCLYARTAVLFLQVTGPHRRGCSVQGYGPKLPGVEAYVYPGSGATCDTLELQRKQAAATAAAAAGTASGLAAEAAAEAAASAAAALQLPGEGAAVMKMEVDVRGPVGPLPGSSGQGHGAAGRGVVNGDVGAAEGGNDGSEGLEEDPDHEFEYAGELSAEETAEHWHLSFLSVLCDVSSFFAPAWAGRPCSCRPAYLPVCRPARPPAWLPAWPWQQAVHWRVPQMSCPSFFFLPAGEEHPTTDGPRIIDVGIPGPGSKV